MKDRETFKPLSRHDVECELYREKVYRIVKENLDPEIETERIKAALALPLSWPDIQAKWVLMKKRKAAKAKQRGEGVNEIMQMLRDLRGLDTERTDLDEMVALSAFGTAMKAEYERTTIPSPDWLDDRLGDLNRAIRLLRQDALEKKLKELETRQEALKTADQKRTDVVAEMAKVKAALGIAG